MKVICAGYSRTGTKSMAKALRILGYTVHDTIDHYELNLDNFLTLYDGLEDATLLQRMYKDVDAVTDAPANLMWHKIFNAFPDAKVILTVRDTPEIWLDSCMNLMSDYYARHNLLFAYVIQPWLSKTSAKSVSLSKKIALHLLPDIPTNEKLTKYPEKLLTSYVNHNTMVKRLIPPSQLLVFNVSEGWENLCKFLETEVPHVDFPKENKTTEEKKVPILEQYFKMNVYKQIDRETRRSLLILAGFIFVAAAMILQHVLQLI